MFCNFNSSSEDIFLTFNDTKALKISEILSDRMSRGTILVDAKQPISQENNKFDINRKIDFDFKNEPDLSNPRNNTYIMSFAIANEQGWVEKEKQLWYKNIDLMSPLCQFVTAIKVNKA